MAHTLNFAALYEYNAGDPGITVPVRLIVESEIVEVSAKLDTGASFCVFRRSYGEAVGLNVEDGIPQRFSTVTGYFLAFGHELTISTLGFEFETTGYFAEDRNFTRDVLGRHGWMQQLKIGIVDYEGKLYVGRYDDAE